MTNNKEENVYDIEIPIFSNLTTLTIISYIVLWYKSNESLKVLDNAL